MTRSGSESNDAQAPLEIAGTTLAPGERRTIQVPLARLPTHADLTLPIHVIHGRRPGPRLFVSAAIHGDEINGAEIVHRLLLSRSLRHLRGTLVAVPVVNVLGFLTTSRYLPDRRDLNRHFPGSERGSLASRLARLFMDVVVDGSTHGLDLHTGALHRSNLPQVRCSLDDEETLRLARAFGAPVVVHARLRDGSLREAARERGIPMLVYEGGEALRFDEVVIRAGVRGARSLMRCIGMLPERRPTVPPVEPLVARSSRWVRAPEGGVLRTTTRLGQRVRVGQRLGVIADPFGEHDTDVVSSAAGMVMGQHRLPLVHEGDALFNVAVLDESEPISDALEGFHEGLDDVAPHPWFANERDPAAPEPSEDPGTGKRD